VYWFFSFYFGPYSFDYLFSFVNVFVLYNLTLELKIYYCPIIYFFILILTLFLLIDIFCFGIFCVIVFQFHFSFPKYWALWFFSFIVFLIWWLESDVWKVNMSWLFLSYFLFWYCHSTLFCFLKQIVFVVFLNFIFFYRI
jgi:hypothetical protein